MRIKERAAKRKMKGITLQYTEDERVFFDDVAGIGDAKVGAGSQAVMIRRIRSIGPEPAYQGIALQHTGDKRAFADDLTGFSDAEVGVRMMAGCIISL